MSDRVCGRCGVYVHLHPTAACASARRSCWWDRHSLRRHVEAAAWRAVPRKARWDLAWWWVHHADRDWCELVDVLLVADRWAEDHSDYECDCDVSLPSDVGPPRYGYCYCVPK